MINKKGPTNREIYIQDYLLKLHLMPWPGPHVTPSMTTFDVSSPIDIQSSPVIVIKKIRNERKTMS